MVSILDFSQFLAHSRSPCPRSNVGWMRLEGDLLFIKHLSPAGSVFNSRESKRMTKVRGLVGGGVLNVNRHTSATCF